MPLLGFFSEAVRTEEAKVVVQAGPVVVPAAKNVFGVIVSPVVPESCNTPTQASIIVLPVTVLLLPVPPQLASR